MVKQIFEKTNYWTNDNIKEYGFYPYKIPSNSAETHLKAKSFQENHISTMMNGTQCARTAGFKISSGLRKHPKQWCHCQKCCGKRWSYVWLFHLRCTYQLRTKSQ